MTHSQLDNDIAMGLPQAIAQEISHAEIGPPIRWLYSWAFMIIMLLGFVIGGVFLWPALGGMVDSNAKLVAQSMSGLSFEANFGVSMVVGLFLWIICVAAIISVFILLLPFRHKATFYLHAKSDFIGPYFKIYGLHRVFETTQPFQDGADYINRICRKMISSLMKIILPVLAIVLGLVWLEMSWYDISTSTHYHENKLLSNKLEPRPWHEATEVELGCNHVKKNSGRYSSSAKNTIIYKVKWSDGSIVRLSTDHQINDKLWLDNFEIIDSSIRSGNAIFRRWEWRERNPLHPICLDHYRSELGAETAARFDRLLRIGELD